MPAPAWEEWGKFSEVLCSPLHSVSPCAGKNGANFMKRNILLIAATCGLAFLIINIPDFNNKAKAQSPTTGSTNVVEIDPDVPVTLGWDYILPDPNVSGFKVYKKIAINNSQIWSLVGQKTITSAQTNLDLNMTIPAPYEGTYSVTAFNSEFESEYSETITLINRPPDMTVPLAPTNLRVIQIK